MTVELSESSECSGGTAIQTHFSRSHSEYLFSLTDLSSNNRNNSTRPKKM